MEGPGSAVNFSLGFPGGALVKNPSVDAGDTSHGFDPWVGRMPWRRKWQPTPVLLPGKSHGQRSLADCRPRGHKESDMIEQSTSVLYGQTEEGTMEKSTLRSKGNASSNPF